MKKVAIITATRAEYGLLFPLITEMMADDFFDCHVIVTGTHLLHKYGDTLKFIQDDKVPIKYIVPIMDENTVEQCRIIAAALNAFSQIYKTEKYDAIVLLGDRYELYGFAIPALLNNIPIIHIHGGEKTEGAVDEQIRHSITKMSAIHFTSTEEYRKRIIQMGENPKNVFAVGALGIDNILRLAPMDKTALSKDLGVDFDNKSIAIVTYHPETLSGSEEAKRQMQIVLESILESDLNAIITMPNSDVGGNLILECILEYVQKYPENLRFFKSLGQLRYLSALRYADFVIGNSSSGIIETASFGIPAIDIGDRQKGRISPKNVIHCICEKSAIKEAIMRGKNPNFITELKNYVNPYGDGHTAKRMVDILKNISWNTETMVRKTFYDI